MSLLPQNETLINQNFANLIDEIIREDYSSIDKNPLTCNASFLPHIALEKGAIIEGMNEKEIRLYLSTFRKEINGTVEAVEKAINVCFDNAKLIEWYESGELKKGTFKVKVSVKSDTSYIYDERLFKLSTRLINTAKNVRSKLSVFDMDMPKAKGQIKSYTKGVFNVGLESQLNLNASVKICFFGGAKCLI